MTHHTDAEQERAEFEDWLGIKPCGAAHDLAWSAWKAARRAPAAPVPQGWRLVPEWPTVEMSVAGDDVYREDGPDVFSSNTIYTRMLAAASQPPEANPVELHQIKNAAPLQLPEPAAWVFKDRTWTEIRAMAVDHNGVPAYTEQQVREILKAHGINVKKSNGE